MKNYLLLMLLLSSFFGCIAQSNITKNKEDMDISFINNEKIKYTIGLMACDTCAPIRNIGHRVILELDKKEQDIVKKISPDTWMKLLNDSLMDYAANLILYNLYDKDAFILSKYDGKELWNKYLRNEDIDYWSKLLKK